MKSNRKRFRWQLDSMSIVFIILGTLLIIFIVLPISTILSNQSLNRLVETLKDKEVRRAIWLSVGTAFCATLIAMLFGIPLAYLLARKNFFGKAFIQGLIDVPVVIPHTVAGIALLMVFGTQGLIGAPLSKYNIRFVDAIPGIIVAMLFVSIPFMINSAREGFESVDPKLENVARSLGAGPWYTFFTISIPLALKAIITGAIMTWARAISEFGAVYIIVYFPKVANVLIYEAWLHKGLAASSSIAALLLIICLVVFVVLRSLTIRWERRRA